MEQRNTRFTPPPRSVPAELARITADPDAGIAARALEAARELGIDLHQAKLAAAEHTRALAQVRQIFAGLLQIGTHQAEGLILYSSLLVTGLTRIGQWLDGKYSDGNIAQFYKMQRSAAAHAEAVDRQLPGLIEDWQLKIAELIVQKKIGRADPSDQIAHNLQSCTHQLALARRSEPVKCHAALLEILRGVADLTAAHPEQVKNLRCILTAYLYPLVTTSREVLGEDLPVEDQFSEAIARGIGRSNLVRYLQQAMGILLPASRLGLLPAIAGDISEQRTPDDALEMCKAWSYLATRMPRAVGEKAVISFAAKVPHPQLFELFTQLLSEEDRLVYLYKALQPWGIDDALPEFTESCLMTRDETSPAAEVLDELVTLTAKKGNRSGVALLFKHQAILLAGEVLPYALKAFEVHPDSKARDAILARAVSLIDRDDRQAAYQLLSTPQSQNTGTRPQALSTPAPRVKKRVSPLDNLQATLGETSTAEQLRELRKLTDRSWTRALRLVATDPNKAHSVIDFLFRHRASPEIARIVASGKDRVERLMRLIGKGARKDLEAIERYLKQESNACPASFSELLSMPEAPEEVFEQISGQSGNEAATPQVVIPGGNFQRVVVFGGSYHNDVLTAGQGILGEKGFHLVETNSGRNLESHVRLGDLVVINDHISHTIADRLRKHCRSWGVKFITLRQHGKEALLNIATEVAARRPQ